MLSFILAIAAILPVNQSSQKTYTMLGWNIERACFVLLDVDERKGFIVRERELPRTHPYWSAEREGR